MRYTLANLIEPFSVEKFLSDYWRQNFLYLAGSDQTRFHGLMNLQEIDRILEAWHLRATSHSVHVKKDGHAIPKIRYCKNSVLGPPCESPPSLVLDCQEIRKLFFDGHTIVLYSVQTAVQSLADLAATLEDILGGRVGANLYCSPRREIAANAHADDHDIIILQIAGTKHWSFFGGEAGGTVYSTDVRAGDVVYIPKGLRHATRATEGLSCHLAVGIHMPTKVEYLMNSIRKAISLQPDPEDLDAISRSCVDAINSLDLSAERSTHERALVASRRRYEGAFFADYEALYSDCGGSFKVSEGVGRIEDVDGRQFRIEVGGEKVNFSNALRPVFEKRILSGKVFSFEDLMDICADREAAILLLTALVRARIVTKSI